jgi:hypothetical protein
MEERKEGRLLTFISTFCTSNIQEWIKEWVNWVFSEKKQSRHFLNYHWMLKCPRN